MVFEFTGVNWVEIVAATIAAVVIGFIWYMPMVFGRRWAAGAGRELPGPGDVNPMIYLVTIGQALITAYVLALVINATGSAALVENLTVATVVWLGFVAMFGLSAVVFEGRSVGYWLINVGYALASLLAMAAIYALI